MATKIEDMTDDEVLAELEGKQDVKRQLLRLYRTRDAILDAGEEWANGDKKKRQSDLAEVEKRIGMLEASEQPCIQFCEVEIVSDYEVIDDNS